MARYVKSGDVVRVPQINSELERIQEAFQDVLDRTGESPNQMEAPLDMNGNEILNVVTDPNNPSSLVSREDVYIKSEVDSKDSSILEQAQEYADTVATGQAVSVVRYVQEEIPTGSILPGARWYKPSEATTYVYYVDEDSSQWVQEAVQSAEGTLRDELAAVDSSVLVGGVEASILANNKVFLESYENLVTGGDWTDAFAAAYADLVALGGGTLEIPVGEFLVSGNGIETLTANTYYALSNVAVRFKGQGFGTVLTRAETLASDTVDLDDASTFHDAVFNVHNSNNIFEDFVIRDSRCGIYLGQIEGEVDTCSVVLNKIKNVWIVDCGMGIHLRSGVGNYYNSFEDVHIWQCQIGIHTDKHPSSLIVPPNNNRNQFRHVRTARCHIGLWMKMGDTNQFIGQHNEGNTLTPTANRYFAPSPLPLGLTGGVGQLLEENAINNQFVACMQESCEVELVNNGDRNSFSGLYRDEVSGKVRHLKFPIFYSTRTMAVTNAGQTFFFTNLQSDIFAGYEAGVEHSLSPLKSVRLTSTDSAVVGDVFSGNYQERTLDVAGAMLSGTTADIAVWEDNVNEGLTAAWFDINVTGNSQSASMAHNTTFKIVALRNTSRTLTRYFVYDVEHGRATGANVGDTSEPFTPTLSVSGKDLILTITAPARDFDNVVVATSKTVAKTV